MTIGRLAGNDIVLNKGNVSKYHSKIVLKDGKYIVVDLKSTNGTFVNGKKIAGPLVVRPTDKIYVGDYIINVDAPPEDYEGESNEGFDDSAAGREEQQRRGARRTRSTRRSRRKRSLKKKKRRRLRKK